MAAVDVVVVSFNSRDRIRGCVEDLATADGVNVIVVDNASTDDSVVVLRDLPVQVIARHTNDGFAVGCNVGWHAGAAPYVMFLNPDAQISPEALARLAEALDA